MLKKIVYYGHKFKLFLGWCADENRELRQKVAELSAAVTKLEVERKDYQAAQLRSYLRKGCEETLRNCEQLIETDEGLKHFGKMWGEYKADTMMMFTAIEYEYIQKYDFTEAEIKVLRHVIGNIGLFFKGCKIAHDTKIELQNLKNSK